MKSIGKVALELAKNIQNDAPKVFVPPSEGTKPISQNVLPFSIVSNTRGYIEKVSNQINGCYEKGWYDSCAVMMRRLLETLIIEVFETFNIASNIKDPKTGDFYFLSQLINITLQENSWNLGRNTKKALPKLKSIGDQSAHSRRYNAFREDIDKLSTDFRSVCQEFIYLSNLK